MMECHDTHITTLTLDVVLRLKTKLDLEVASPIQKHLGARKRVCLAPNGAMISDIRNRASQRIEVSSVFEEKKNTNRIKYSFPHSLIIISVSDPQRVYSSHQLAIQPSQSQSIFPDVQASVLVPVLGSGPRFGRC